MDELLSVTTIIGSSMFIILIGMRLFNLKFIKQNDGTWIVYNKKVLDDSNRALKELKNEIDTLTKRVRLSEKRAELLKTENASLKELCKSREEQVSSLSSAIEEHNIYNEPSTPEKEPDNTNHTYAVIRHNGLKERSEEAIRNSAETLNRMLVRNQDSNEQ